MLVNVIISIFENQGCTGISVAKRAVSC